MTAARHVAATAGRDAGRIVPGLDRAALGSVLLLPLLLLHAHGIGEGAIAITDLCYLARSAATHEWSWLRTSWFRVGLAWWGWVVFCSLPIPMLGLGIGGLASLTQALVNVRFLVLVAAMEHVVLRDPAARRWLWRIVAAATAYIAAQSLVQFTFGHNLYGRPPGGDGELTGPFAKPRAGPPLSRILLPAVLPSTVGLLQRRGVRPALAAYGVLVGGAAVMVLIGQRMPLLLVGLGLLVAALLLPRLRPLVLAAGVACAVLLAASPLVAPSAYHRLVAKFFAQMQHFATTQYGELYARAWQIGLRQAPIGLGADGFRYGCKLPRYFRPSFDGSVADGGGAAICWHHPHNFYFEALDNGGFIGLALFCWLAVAWLRPLARGLWRHPEPLRVALFAAAAIQLWPIASASGFTSMPMGGWFFLLLGWGMAEARWRAARDDG